MGRIEDLRRFNRTVSTRIGVLHDRFLGRDRPLGEARLIYEIGEAGAELRDLRARLELDSGYLSRLLRSLEKQGLVAGGAAEDARVRRVALTPAGLAELAELDRRSDDLAQSLLAPLDEKQRAKLVAAMNEVTHLLAASSLTIEAAPADSGDAKACLASYYAELQSRFDAGYDPAKGAPTDAAQFAPPRGIFLLARTLGRTIGCAALRTWAPRVGEVKRVWVSKEARGLGVARRLMDAVETHARGFCFKTLRLDTNRTLTEAQALYRSLGYREIARYNDERYADHWFEKRL